LENWRGQFSAKLGLSDSLYLQNVVVPNEHRRSIFCLITAVRVC